MERGKYHWLIWRMSIKDTIEICMFYGISAVIFQTRDILHNARALALFIFLALAFAFIDESIFIRRGRWQYASTMPLVFGIGLTPLLELAVTGTLTLFIVFG